VRNVSNKICMKYQNTHFIFNNYFPWITLFSRLCGKLRYSQTGHRWQYNIAHFLIPWTNKAFRNNFRVCDKSYISPYKGVWIFSRTRLNVLFLRKMPVLYNLCLWRLFIQNLFGDTRNMLKYDDVILLIRPQVWKFAITILRTATKIKTKETIKIF